MQKIYKFSRFILGGLANYAGSRNVMREKVNRKLPAEVVTAKLIQISAIFHTKIFQFFMFSISSLINFDFYEFSMEA